MSIDIKNQVILRIIREMAWTKTAETWRKLTNKTIPKYIELVSKIYDDNKKVMENPRRTIDEKTTDLIEILKNNPLFEDFFNLYSSPVNENMLNQFKSLYIDGDSNCLFRCLQYLDKPDWQNLPFGNGHATVRNDICDKLDILFEGGSFSGKKNGFLLIVICVCT